jgi:hypothetical protein
MSKEAMTLALEALNKLDKLMKRSPDTDKAIKALEEALKQEQGEPFGYFKAEPFGWTDCAETDEGAVALYERPQSAQKPLTDEQKFALIEKCLGLKKRTEDTVIDRYTGLFTDSARYFALIDAAYNFKE